MTDREPHRPVSAARAWLFGCWLAVAAGSVEVLILAAKLRWNPLMSVGRDFWWMAPVALLAIVVVATTVVALLGRLWRNGPVVFLVIAVASALAFLDLLLLVPRLAHWAAALLAAGMAFRLAGALQREPERIRQVVRRGSIPVVAVFLAIGGQSWLSSGSMAPASPREANPGAPNVVLITLDTVRAANLSVYGYPRDTTPELARLARGGVVFETALTAAPWTLPSHASMFTGRWPTELSTDYETPLDARDPTIAEVLARQGYRTGGFVANLKYCGINTGMARGFEVYEDYPRSLGQIVASSTIARMIGDNFSLRRLIGSDQHLNRVTADEINARALSWIGRERGTPFFLFLNYFDAHEPYLPPEPFNRQFGPGRPVRGHSPLHHWLWNPAVAHAPMAEKVRQEELDAYDGAIASLDAKVGALFVELDRLQLLKNTIVIITSDHGEEFGEHAVFEHGYSLYRPALQVPLIVIAPGRAPAGVRVPVPVSLRDLAATVADLAGSTGTSFPGESLARHWRSSGPADAVAGTDRLSPLFSEVQSSPGQPDWFPSNKGLMRSIVTGGYRYIRNGDGTEELYDFVADPWERTNLAGQAGLQGVLGEARTAAARLPGGNK